jgi:salicylate hydroxylase|tara:strand:- start:10381 stop:11505 length:1125 start_codon:yes stop_codon:yes gene_type:complete
MKKKIAIIGAGIAGLTLGNLLQKNLDYEFTIYEKGETLNLDEGFGIQLAVNSIYVLNQIGFNELNKSNTFHPKALDFYSNRNKVCDLNLTQFNTRLEKYTTLKRSSLIKFLKDKLFSNVFKFNKKVQTIEHEEKKIKIKFTDGETDEVDYLIVSDGIFSDTRTIIENKKYKKIFQGAFALRNIINKDHLEKLNNDNISLFMCPKAHLVLYPVNESEYNFVAIIRGKMDSFDDKKKIFLNNILKQNNLNSLLNNNLSFWPVYNSRKSLVSEYKNIFYLGDAFYAFPPTMAQGASQSIEAADELSKIFEKDILDKQNFYFTNRIKRTKIISKRSNFNFFIFHLSNSLLVKIRNIILRKLIYNRKFIDIFLGRVFRK